MKILVFCGRGKCLHSPRICALWPWTVFHSPRLVALWPRKVCPLAQTGDPLFVAAGNASVSPDLEVVICDHQEVALLAQTERTGFKSIHGAL
jgi:hypothetical protein